MSSNSSSSSNYDNSGTEFKYNKYFHMLAHDEDLEDSINFIKAQYAVHPGFMAVGSS